MIKQGIDLSRWNIVTSFKDVKDSGIDFVIIRIGGSNGGFYKDTKFELYYKAAKKAGLKVGCYYDTGKDFIDSASGYIAAEHCLRLLDGHQFEYPVFMDIETAATVYKKGITDAAIAFGSKLESYKYYVGVYASDVSGFHDRLEIERVKRFSLWVARYGKKPQYVTEFAMWQKSSTGSVPGITGKVDLDECVVNFPYIIKKAKLNNLED